MNLNFYDPSSVNNLQNIQTALNEQLNKLDALRNITNNNNPVNVNQPLKENRYYLDCGNREDWQEFLKVNYSITENEIFNDYKLFLQAKEELKEDTNKEKLQSMKDKISGVDKGKKEYSKQSNNIITNYTGEVNGTNNTTNNIQTTSTINDNKFTKNTNQFENKGVKHVR